MGIFFGGEKAALLQKTQENLELSQKNMEIVASALNRLPTTQPTKDEQLFSDEEKRRAAYALNLCMISVSQIVDYNDEYILEQEYETILNNLNLEEMPKDEALLNILKQLLDTVTFFRIQEGDKKMIEKKYQHQMKNAIWAAIPNIGLLVAGGDPVTTAISLVSQVGIGYMSYRRTKASTLLERTVQEWQLQRSAIEQFNGLRRELFDTAWRLADRYHFPDEYRITEQQITRYNETLLDEDPLRRYERLAYAEENFAAYPPFWYYLGHAANEVYRSDVYAKATRDIYREHAVECFDKLLNQTERNLLREDQMLSSCALEYFEILIQSGYSDRSYLEELIAKAIGAAGNSHDVLELCALGYLQLGNHEEAAKLLRMLVNEDYNKTVNAQLLSSLYVAEYIKTESWQAKGNYKTLCSRVEPQFLFPMPKAGEYSSEELNRAFGACQKHLFCEKYIIVLEKFFEKYSTRYENAMRRAVEHTAGENRLERVLFVLNSLYVAVGNLPFISSPDVQRIYNSMKTKLQENSIAFMHLKEMNADNSVLEEDRVENNLSFEHMTEDVFQCIVEVVSNQCKELPATMDQIVSAERVLRTFCEKEDIPMPELEVSPQNLSEVEQKVGATIDIGLLQKESKAMQDQRRKMAEMISAVKAHQQNLIATGAEKMELYLSGSNDFYKYFKRNHELDADSAWNTTVAVINDTSVKDRDLLITTDGLRFFGRWDIKRAVQDTPALALIAGPGAIALMALTKSSQKIISKPVPYGDIRETDDRITKLKIDNVVYNHKNINMKALGNLFDALAVIDEKYTKDTTEGQKRHITSRLKELIFSE